MAQSSSSLRLDFDGKPDKLIQDAVTFADTHQSLRNQQCERDWLLWLAYKDAIDSNPELPQIALPKMLSIVEQKVPEDTDALFGRRPIIPFTARRDEYKPIADIQTDLLDEYLWKAGIYDHGSDMIKWKILYGTAFMDVIPYFEVVEEKAIEENPLGGMRIVTKRAPRLRLKIETWAPWDVYIDPHATNLKEKDGCRYAIKINLVSKRAIKNAYHQKMYPDLDIAKLDDKAKQSSTRYRGENFGLQMLARYGLPVPADDDDMGVLLRYESPDRYVDSWMGEVTLRDTPNPFKHGRINLSKISHIRMPHSQERFWGMGEGKLNEVQIAMLDDTWNMTFATHGMMGQPAVFYRQGHINYKDIVFGLGRRIPVKNTSDRPISDDVLIHSGTEPSAAAYLLPDRIERNIDLASGQFAPGRGELSGADNTATEVLTTDAKGEKRQAHSIRMGEHEWGQDFATKSVSIVDQFGNLDDYTELVGLQKALYLITANPGDLPGGFNISFEGSGRVAERIEKRNNLMAAAPLLQGDPAARPGGLARTLLELMDFDDKESMEMILTQEEILQQQQREALIALAGMGMQSQQIENDNQEQNKAEGAKKNEKAA